MIGAIAGDVIGSVFEFDGHKSTEFPLFCGSSTFTDDSVLTAAVAAAILDGRDYGETLREFGRRYPWRGSGPRFGRWLADASMGPYNSWGDGSAMRVSPVGLRRRAAGRGAVRPRATHAGVVGDRGSVWRAVREGLMRRGMFGSIADLVLAGAGP
jgi:ADP-ribosylglycohydrolase